jgi:nucleoside-diphosphate-sugar epimerase
VSGAIHPKTKTAKKNSFVADIQRISAGLGWRPTVDLQQGLKLL